MKDGEIILFCILFIAAGLFSILASLFNWDFFFNDRKSRTIVNIFGRTGARILYTVLGIFIIAMGVMAIVAP